MVEFTDEQRQVLAHWLIKIRESHTLTAARLQVLMAAQQLGIGYKDVNGYWVISGEQIKEFAPPSGRVRPKRLCSVCRLPQRKTPSGWVCPQGHGGAPALEPEVKPEEEEDA